MFLTYYVFIFTAPNGKQSLDDTGFYTERDDVAFVCANEIIGRRIDLSGSVCLLI